MRSDEYTPGVCNIGRRETLLRGQVGYVCAGLSVGLLAALINLHVAPAWRLVLFVPVFLSALGFLQARRGFCVKYGLSGAFNFGDEVGKTEHVAEAESRRRDRNTSLAVIATAATIALVTALVAVWLPPLW